MVIKFWCRGIDDRDEKVFSSWAEAKEVNRRLSKKGVLVLRIFAAMDVQEFDSLYQEAHYEY